MLLYSLDTANLRIMDYCTIDDVKQRFDWLIFSIAGAKLCEKKSEPNRTFTSVTLHNPLTLRKNHFIVRIKNVLI